MASNTNFLDRLRQLHLEAQRQKQHNNNNNDDEALLDVDNNSNTSLKPSNHSEIEQDIFLRCCQDDDAPKNNSNSTWIELNVGGASILTLRENFTSSKAKGSDLAVFARNDFADFPRDSQGRPFIDAEPRVFRHILNYLREYPICCHGADAALTCELAASFGLMDLEEKLGGTNGLTTSCAPDAHHQRSNMAKRFFPKIPRFIHGPGVSADGLVLSSSLIVGRNATCLPNHTTFAENPSFFVNRQNVFKNKNNNNNNNNNVEFNTPQKPLRVKPHGHRMVYRIVRFNPLHELAFGVASEQVHEKFGGGPQNLSNNFSTTQDFVTFPTRNVSQVITGSKHSVMMLNTGTVYATVDDVGPRVCDAVNQHCDGGNGAHKHQVTCALIHQTKLEKEREEEHKRNISVDKNRAKVTFEVDLPKPPVEERRIFKEGDVIEVCVNYLASVSKKSCSSYLFEENEQQKDSVKNPREIVRSKKQKEINRYLRKSRTIPNMFLDDDEDSEESDDDNAHEDTSVTGIPAGALAREGDVQFFSNFPSDANNNNNNNCLPSGNFDPFSSWSENNNNNNNNKSNKKKNGKKSASKKKRNKAVDSGEEEEEENNEENEHLVPGLMITISRIRVNTCAKNPPSSANNNNQKSKDSDSTDNKYLTEKQPPIDFCDSSLNAVKLFNSVFTDEDFVMNANLHFSVILGGSSDVEIVYASHLYPEEIERGKDDDDDDDRDNNNNDDDYEVRDKPPKNSTVSLHTENIVNENCYHKNSNHHDQKFLSSAGSFARFNSVRHFCTEKRMTDEGGNRIMMLPRCIDWINSKSYVASKSLKKALYYHKVEQLTVLHEKNKLMRRIVAPIGTSSDSLEHLYPTPHRPGFTMPSL